MLANANVVPPQIIINLEPTILDTNGQIPFSLAIAKIEQVEIKTANEYT